MKKRIKIDSALLSIIIIFTGVLYIFKGLYWQSLLVDNIKDCFGLVLILKGSFLRMSGRGHKKAHSKRSESLVTSGPYTLTRNPMYLGSFLLGCGFVLLVWPLWLLPVFAWLFYVRFNKQMIKEEEFLTKSFGETYKTYCRKVPRLFPKISKMLKAKTREIFNFDEMFSTKESRNLWTWPLLAFVLESLQEILIFGGTDLVRTLLLFIVTFCVYLCVFMVSYQKN